MAGEAGALFLLMMMVMGFSLDHLPILRMGIMNMSYSVVVLQMAGLDGELYLMPPLVQIVIYLIILMNMETMDLQLQVQMLMLHTVLAAVMQPVMAVEAIYHQTLLLI